MTQHILLSLILFLILGCQQKQTYLTPPGYDLNQPEKMIMKESLLEISGITFYSVHSDTILAINDEEGKLYYFTFNGDKIESTKFTKGSGDFEDITVYKNKIFVLRSDGTIFTFLKDLENITSQKLEIDVPKGEYESIYADEEESKLYVICKKCEGGSGKNEIQGHVMDLSDKGFSLKPFSIDISSIKQKIKKSFMASAIAKNQKTKEWFIISSVNKLLVITDEEFKIKSSFSIDPSIFNQPEGMAFDAEGNLYISNEGDDFSNGNILKFGVK